ADGMPAQWHCNAGRTARYECSAGRLHFENCGAPGSCVPSPAGWPDQCHGCRTCTASTTTTPALGQPYVWNCNVGTNVLEHCIDVTTGGNCIRGTSDPTHCCVVDNHCVTGNCVAHPVGQDDVCP